MSERNDAIQTLRAVTQARLNEIGRQIQALQAEGTALMKALNDSDEPEVDLALVDETTDTEEG